MLCHKKGNKKIATLEVVVQVVFPARGRIL